MSCWISLRGKRGLHHLAQDNGSANAIIRAEVCLVGPHLLPKPNLGGWGTGADRQKKTHG